MKRFSLILLSVLLSCAHKRVPLVAPMIPVCVVEPEGGELASRLVSYGWLVTCASRSAWQVSAVGSKETLDVLVLTPVGTTAMHKMFRPTATDTVSALAGYAINSVLRGI